MNSVSFGESAPKGERTIRITAEAHENAVRERMKLAEAKADREIRPGLAAAIEDVGSNIRHLQQAVADLDGRLGALLRPEATHPPDDLPCVWESVHCQSLYRQSMDLRNLVAWVQDITERLEL